MSNRTFLALVSVAIIMLIGAIAVHKFEACMQFGGKACPYPRSHWFSGASR